MAPAEQGRTVSAVAVCADCGWRGHPARPAYAAAAARLHSCDTHRRRQATAERAAARRAASGPEQPCVHGGKHPHGHRNRYVIDRCRCRACRDAASAYERWRAKQRAYGRQAYVDAGAARAHVNTLQSQGMGWKRIARAAGLSESVVWKLLYGDPSRRLAPSKRIRQGTAARLLEVTLDIAGGARVPAGRTWDQVHGLMAIGYTQAWISARIGQGGRALQLGDAYVTAAHAAAIEQLVEAYATIPGPSRRARNTAAARGWTADLLWPVDSDAADDGGIDEIAVERAMNGDPVRLDNAERAEAARRLLAAGLLPSQIAQRLRLSGRTARALIDALEEEAA